MTLPGSWKSSREEQKCQKGICRAVEGVLCKWLQGCAPMHTASLLQKWQNVVATGSRGSFSEQLFPVLAVLATLRSVSPFCSGGRNQAILKNGRWGLVQVLCDKRWVTATVPVASGNQDTGSGKLLCRCCGAELWHSCAPHLVSSDVVACPSLDVGILTVGDHMGVCCSWAAENPSLTLCVLAALSLSQVCSSLQSMKLRWTESMGWTQGLSFGG